MIELETPVKSRQTGRAPDPPARPRVSVIIPCYNHEPYIESAVLSVLRQETDFPFETIVSDDCSTDASRERLERLRQAHGDRLRVLTAERNRGARQNFLHLLRACRGDYVAYLDGDDFWVGTEKLQAQFDLMEANPDLALCFHPVYVCDEEGEITQVSRMQPKTVKASYDFQEIVPKNLIPSCSIFFRRALFQGFPAWMADYPSVPGDLVMTLNLARQGGIGFVNAKMAAYRVHERGMWSAEDEYPRLKALARAYANMLPGLDPADAKAMRSSQACVRVRIAAALAQAGRTRRARLYLRCAWAEGWRLGPVWRQSFIYLLDVHVPALSRWLRSVAQARLKVSKSNRPRRALADRPDS